MIVLETARHSYPTCSEEYSQPLRQYALVTFPASINPSKPQTRWMDWWLGNNATDIKHMNNDTPTMDHSASKESLISNTSEWDAPAKTQTNEPWAQTEAGNKLTEETYVDLKFNDLQRADTKYSVASSTTLQNSYFTPSVAEADNIKRRLILPRGVGTSAGPGQHAWLPVIQVITQYTFTNPDLLEEALETPGSGVTYEAKTYIHSITGFRNLEKIGRSSKINQFIRPRVHLRGSRRKNPLFLLKDDVQREDPSRIIARAMKAIIGAVFWDGGLEAATKVMKELQLTIVSPQPKA
ncbi:hypothetical protein G7Y89_g14923 [Cudoniella acicularis]|uniref:RNase III domain-containing protein n=1 Tax=Cudoniella acicularis TaxID=354080 RepID=A0A8H4QVQ3_9HELO|nr:hypothetical protein G7Y89_g14923 [Cudoniella acicularis]